MNSRTILLALVPGLVLTGCDDERPAPEPVRPVLSMIVGQAASAHSAVGTVEPRYETDLGFRVLGRLVTRAVDVGDQVAKGQTVAAIDPTSLRLAVESARAALAQAEARLANARYTEERKRALVATETDPQQALDDAEQVRAGAEASVARARAGLAKALEQLGYAQVQAEFDGVVTGVGAEIGQVVSPGQTVVAIARPDVREAVVDVGTDFPVPLGTDMAFEVCHELRPDSCIVGRVREIGPDADPVTRTRRVRIALENPPATFRLGSTVRASVAAPSDGSLRVPGTAVLARDGGTHVWVVDPHSETVSLHKVEVQTDAAGVRVTGGLPAGIRIVTAGVNSLHPGQKVRVEGDSAP